MLHFCTVNRRIMEARRKNEVYVTLLIDLVNAGVITKAKAESLLGYTLPAHVLDSSDDTPGDDTPGDDTPGNDTPGDDTPGNDTPGDDTPTDDNTSQGD